MNPHTQAHAMDGFDVWFFGGTPGPSETDPACTRMDATDASDEDDARIPSYAHRCDCGQHVAALAGNAQSKPRAPARSALLALQV